MSRAHKLSIRVFAVLLLSSCCKKEDLRVSENRAFVVGSGANAEVYGPGVHTICSKAETTMYFTTDTERWPVGGLTSDSIDRSFMVECRIELVLNDLLWLHRWYGRNYDYHVVKKWIEYSMNVALIAYSSEQIRVSGHPMALEEQVRDTLSRGLARNGIELLNVDLRLIQESVPDSELNIEDRDYLLDGWLAEHQLERSDFTDSSATRALELWAYGEPDFNVSSYECLKSTNESWTLCTNSNLFGWGSLLDEPPYLEYRFVNQGTNWVYQGILMDTSSHLTPIGNYWYDPTTAYMLLQRDDRSQWQLIKLKMNVDSIWRYGANLDSTDSDYAN